MPDSTDRRTRASCPRRCPPPPLNPLRAMRPYRAPAPRPGRHFTQSLWDKGHEWGGVGGGDVRRLQRILRRVSAARWRQRGHRRAAATEAVGGAQEGRCAGWKSDYSRSSAKDTKKKSRGNEGSNRGHRKRVPTHGAGRTMRLTHLIWTVRFEWVRRENVHK